MYLVYISAYVGSMCMDPKRTKWTFVCAHMCPYMLGRGGGGWMRERVMGKKTFYVGI